MASRLWKAPLNITEHGIAGLWIEFDLCADINKDHILPFHTLRNPVGNILWDRASLEQQRSAEKRYEAAGRIIDLFKTDRIPYRIAVARIQELFST